MVGRTTFLLPSFEVGLALAVERIPVAHGLLVDLANLLDCLAFVVVLFGQNIAGVHGFRPYFRPYIYVS
jgi:hypothetical protein